MDGGCAKEAKISTGGRFACMRIARVCRNCFSVASTYTGRKYRQNDFTTSNFRKRSNQFWVRFSQRSKTHCRDRTRQRSLSTHRSINFRFSIRQDRKLSGGIESAQSSLRTHHSTNFRSSSRPNTFRRDRIWPAYVNARYRRTVRSIFGFRSD